MDSPVIAIGFLAFLVFSGPTYGQADLTTELLLQRSSQINERSEDSTSTVSKRYRQRQSPKVNVPQPPQKSEAPVVLTVEPENAAVMEPEVPPMPPETPSPAPELSQQVVNPFNVRLALTPFFFQNESQSNYWPRRYSTNGFGYGIGIQMGVVKNWDLTVESKATLPTLITSSPSGGVRTIVHYFETSAFFGPKIFADKKSTAGIGLALFSKDLAIGKDEDYRQGLHSEGAGAYFDYVEGEKNRQRVLIQFFPKLFHQELKTDSIYRSGKFESGHAVNVQFSRARPIAQNSQIEYGVSFRIEKDIFLGSVSAPDPRSNQAPSGVEVTDQTLNLFFGFGWGQ